MGLEAQVVGIKSMEDSGKGLWGGPVSVSCDEARPWLTGYPGFWGELQAGNQHPTPSPLLCLSHQMFPASTLLPAVTSHSHQRDTSGLPAWLGHSAYSSQGLPGATLLWPTQPFTRSLHSLHSHWTWMSFLAARLKHITLTLDHVWSAAW